MHRTGHWLGLDVHDAGEYKRAGQWRALEPGMALTVEPLRVSATDYRHGARSRKQSNPRFIKSLR